MNNKIKIILSSVLLIVFSIIIFKFLYPAVSPHYSIAPKISKDSAVVISINALKKLNLYNDNLEISTSLKSNNEIIRQIQSQHGIKKANQLLRDSLNGYFWEIRVENFNAREAMLSKNHAKVLRAVIGEIKFTISMSGQIVNYSYNKPDSITVSPISYIESYKIANDFLKNFTPYSHLTLDSAIVPSVTQTKQSLELSLNNKGVHNETKIETEPETHADYKFSVTTKNELTGNKIIINISTYGNLLTKYSVDEETPKQFSESDSMITEIGSAFIYFFIVIILIIIAFKRYRAYEIGFKFGLIVGLISGLIVVSDILINAQTFSWEILLPITFSLVFITLGVMIAWAVSESITREVWNEKLFSVDLFYNGYFTHSKVGKGIVRGTGFGFLVLASWLILGALVNNLMALSILPFNGDTSEFTSNFHSLFVFTKAFNQTLFPSALMFLFLASIIKLRTRKNIWIILAVGVVFGFISTGAFRPLYIGIPINIILGCILTYIFIKYDYLTVFISIMVYYSLSIAVSYFYIDTNVIGYSHIIYLGIISLIYIIGISSLFSKQYVIDLQAITPKFAKHISERQRLQGELQVARDVQMSFLPQKSPVYDGIDLAAKCIPAYEVGGDYYDFIKIADNRFGIAIGDVSGKGTKAAFYMTLTKGFLKATSRFYVSPAAILSNMNNMFYENVERGSFISMIYADVDITNNTLVIARAGHNPLLCKRHDSDVVESYKPNGIALGLEKGDIFGKTITEKALQLNTGDIFLFYTDGITEAENSKKEEYGEHRLIDLLKTMDGLSAEEILNAILEDVHKFTGKTSQHDDITLIVMKVK